MKIEEYEAAAEAILFAMGDSVELKKLAFALQVGEREAELIVRNLADRYQASNCEAAAKTSVDRRIIGNVIDCCIQAAGNKSRD